MSVPSGQIHGACMLKTWLLYEGRMKTAESADESMPDLLRGGAKIDECKSQGAGRSLKQTTECGRYQRDCLQPWNRWQERIFLLFKFQGCARRAEKPPAKIIFFQAAVHLHLRR